MQNFIALIYSGPSLLLASEARRVVEVVDDAPIREIQLGCEAIVMLRERQPAREVLMNMAGAQQELASPAAR
jgi:hypothetical protein